MKSLVRTLMLVLALFSSRFAFAGDIQQLQDEQVTQLEYQVASALTESSTQKQRTQVIQKVTVLTSQLSALQTVVLIDHLVDTVNQSKLAGVRQTQFGIMSGLVALGLIYVVVLAATRGHKAFGAVMLAGSILNTLLAADNLTAGKYIMTNADSFVASLQALRIAKINEDKTAHLN